MNSSRSLPAAGSDSGQPQTIVSSYKAADTGRRRFFVQVTGSSSKDKTICPVCGGTKRRESKMCRQCYQEARERMVTLQCSWCGKAFERAAYLQERWQRRGLQDTYCSRKCSQAHHAVKHARRCALCGKALPNRHNKYCSPECRKAARPAKQKQPCAWCGVEMTPTTTRTQFCSRTCADAAHSVRMRGKGNSHFKTGTSYAKWFAEMRPLIMERDEHRCVVCQKVEQTQEVLWSGQTVTRTNLAIHHIDEDVTNNRPENLITLCKGCHLSYHKSKQTRWLWFAAYALGASQSMTSKWMDAITSLQTAYSFTTA